MNTKKPNIMRELVSGENGIISSKRVMGVITLVICLGCTIWLVIAEGGTSVVENLLQTLMMMATALLGISSVTGIWRKGKHVETAKTVEELNKEENQFNPDDPCKNCIYNKNKETA